jgi:hypothetical protein
MFEFFINCLFFLLGLICFGVAITIVLFFIVALPVGYKELIALIREELSDKSDEEDSDL